jgi:hypothetical protein
MKLSTVVFIGGVAAASAGLADGAPVGAPFSPAVRAATAPSVYVNSRNAAAAACLGVPGIIPDHERRKICPNPISAGPQPVRVWLGGAVGARPGVP